MTKKGGTVMSKQEEIRDGLKRIQFFKWDADVFYLTESNVKRLFEYLDLQGVMIKVDRELPKYTVDISGQLKEIKDAYFRYGQESLTGAGYVAFEPLIGEE